MTTNTAGPSDRLEVIDAIRGLALMGLFLVHMVEYFELYWYAPEHGWVHELIFGLFGGKAFALFALMFGVSFHVLLEGPASRASLSGARYAWRMLLLWGLGYLHSLIYAGDILQLLAIGGLLLLVLHRLSDTLLVALAVIFLLQIPFFLQYALLLPDPNYTQPLFWEASGRNFEIFASETLAKVLMYNAWQGQIPKWILNYETGALWTFLGLFFAGIVLGRRRCFEKRQPSKTYFLAAALLGATAFFIADSRSRYAIYVEPSMHRWVFEAGLQRVQNFCMVGMYVSLAMVMYGFRSTRYLMKPFVACGRASLSLYILQSLVFVPVFYKFGLNWHESIGQQQALALGLLAWLVQLAIANIWLNYHRHAPLEFLWRRATRFKS